MNGASFELVTTYTLRIRYKFRNCQRKTVRKSVIVMFAFAHSVSLYLGFWLDFLVFAERLAVLEMPARIAP